MKYLMVLQHGAMDEYLYKDILEQDNVREFKVSAPDCNKILYKIRRVHTSTIATKYFEPPLKEIWYKRKLTREVDNETYVVFQMAAMIHVGMKTLRSLKKRYPGAKLVLLLVDSIEAHSFSMKYAKRFIFGFDWDLILSFDKKDCDKYGFTYLGYSYYSKLETDCDTGIVSDLYYIGAIKDEDSRGPLLDDIYKKCIAGGALCDFTLLSPNKDQNIDNGIKIINKGIPYKEVISQLTSSNCILELLQSGQNNQTARYMEAVCYNKKLLTNNKNVKALPFYDERYIKIFSTAEDIDVEWLKDRATVDYGYQGEFSPLKIIEIIQNAFNQ